MSHEHSTEQARRPLLTATAAVVLAIVLSSFGPRPAHGCSCVHPEHWGFFGPADGRLPANASGVLWFKPKVYDKRYRLKEPPSTNRIAARITVEKWAHDRFKRVRATARSIEGFPGVFVVAPREGLVAGARYRFTDRGSILRDEYPDWADSIRQLGSGPHRQVQVTVDAEELSAGSSLVLRAAPSGVEPIVVASGGGACSVQDPTPHASLEAGLPSEAEKWRGQLLFRTLVNGEPWAGAESLCSTYPSGRSWRQVGQDVVYSSCQDVDPLGETPIAFSEPGGRFRELAPASHNVKMQAFLPGTDIVLGSPTMTVDLSCPGFLEE